MGSHASGLNFKKGGAKLVGAREPRWLPAAIHGEAGRSEWYRRVQGALPRRLVVVVAVGEHHVDGELCSGGRRLGWSRNSSERAAEIKLTRGLGSW